MERRKTRGSLLPTTFPFL